MTEVAEQRAVGSGVRADYLGQGRIEHPRRVPAKTGLGE